ESAGSATSTGGATAVVTRRSGQMPVTARATTAKQRLTRGNPRIPSAQGLDDFRDVVAEGGGEAGERPRAVAVADQFAADGDAGFAGEFAQRLRVDPPLRK